jgi:hypothetical protein
LLKTVGHTLEPIGQGAKLIGPPRGADERICLPSAIFGRPET